MHLLELSNQVALLEDERVCSREMMSVLKTTYGRYGLRLRRENPPNAASLRGPDNNKHASNPVAAPQPQYDINYRWSEPDVFGSCTYSFDYRPPQEKLNHELPHLYVEVGADQLKL